MNHKIYVNKKLFQVLECSWDELLTKVKEAEDLDYIIAAHQMFLDTITARCLLDEQSRVGNSFIKINIW